MIILGGVDAEEATAAASPAAALTIFVPIPASARSWKDIGDQKRAAGYRLFVRKAKRGEVNSRLVSSNSTISTSIWRPVGAA